MRVRACASLLGAVLIATGCGTYRSGYISMPYVGETAPSREAAGSGASGWDRLRYISLREVELYINLMNDIETSAPWQGIVLQRTPGQHCILLYLRPAIPGVSVEPRLVSLSVNEVSRAVATVERFVGSTGNRSEEVTEARIPLAQGQRNRFRLCFPGERANPDQNITLDLSRALRHPDNLPFPLIKFKMQRFRHLYS